MRSLIKLFLGIGLASSLGACLLLTQLTYELQDQEALFEQEENRRSVTFLLGEDKQGNNYFSLAEAHFLFDEKEKTDIVVNSCRSLEDMILYLNEDTGQQKWGTIQVVMHGNPWQGLSLPIMNDGLRATKRQLAKAIVDNPLPALESAQVDSMTKINFWGCGIGKNPFINIALDSFFTLPDGDRPKLYTSPHFVVFKEVSPDLPPKRIKASYWPYVFKRGYRPSAELISQELKKQHPDVNVDWSEALQKDATARNETYHNAFHLPVSWTVEYPDKASRPNLDTEAEKLAWVKSQPELMSQIEALGLPLEKYTWTVGKRITKNENGRSVPVVKAIGMATVLYVLQEENI